MVRVFPKLANQRNEIALTICNPISRYCFQLMRDWKLENVPNGKKFPSFRSEWKKRSTFEGTPQFPNGISRKLPYHLTSNRNFRIFWPNGKHPTLPWTPKKCVECSLCCNQSQARSLYHRIHRQRTVFYLLRNKLFSFCFNIQFFFCM